MNKIRQKSEKKKQKTNSGAENSMSEVKKNAIESTASG